MRLSRFFIAHDLSPGQTITLPAQLVNYIVNVLRLKSGAEIILFNGQPYCNNSGNHSGEFSAVLTEVSKRGSIALINSFIKKDVESPLRSHLFQGISRSERMDYTIQKAVELGVTSITPVFTQRSNLKKLNDKQLNKKLLHWQAIANSACEQSGRTHIVTLNSPIQVKQIGDFSADISLLLSPTAQSGAADLHSLSISSVNIFIGPEGGLSDAEINYANNQGYRDISLGKRILRTETAGLAILSLLQFLWGDLGC